MIYRISRMAPAQPFCSIQRDTDGAVIPLDLGNRDLIQFIIDWQGGADVRGDLDLPYAYDQPNYEALSFVWPPPV